MKSKEAQYLKLQVEAAETGWVVTQDGKKPEVFIKWKHVVRYLASQLSNKQEKI